jgi:hypothetical protein
MNVTISGLRGRRKKAARITLGAHLAAALLLGAVMATIVGPSAPMNLADSVMLARLQLLLLAVAGLVQAALLGNWIRLELLRRRARNAMSQAPAFAVPAGYLGGARYREDRVDRIAVQGCMATIVAACWLAEIGYLPPATYQISSGGFGDQNVGFTIGCLVIFAALAITCSFTAGVCKLSQRNSARIRAAFAPLTGQEADRIDPAVAQMAFSQARSIALRKSAISWILATIIVLFAAWAAATGNFGLRIGLITVAFLLVNMTWAIRWFKAAGKLRRAEQSQLQAHLQTWRSR